MSDSATLVSGIVLLTMAGFFRSVIGRDPQRPNRLRALIIVGREGPRRARRSAGRTGRRRAPGRRTVRRP